MQPIRLRKLRRGPGERRDCRESSRAVRGEAPRSFRPERTRKYARIGSEQQGGGAPLCEGCRRSQTLKLSPQPHASLTFGLVKRKPSFRPARVKSSSIPSRYGRLFGSTTTVTPWLSKRRSSGRNSSAYSSL